MAKLTKQQAKMHRQACELLEQDTLKLSEKEFVLEHWNEAAENDVGAAGAFFTPLNLAGDFFMDAPVSGRVVDLCAGIGHLSFANYHYRDGRRADNSKPDITCIELNPRYVEIGRKILPEATWICADALDPELWAKLGVFDGAYSNPPFSSPNTYTNRSKTAGGKMEFAIIEQAVKVSRFEAGFIIPQNSSPFRYSGARNFAEKTHGPGVDHFNKTGIMLRPGAGVDADFYLQEWKNTAPRVELVFWDTYTDGELLKPDFRCAPEPAKPAPAPMAAAPQPFPVEITPQGAQLVIPGAEKRQSPAKRQLELF